MFGKGPQRFVGVSCLEAPLVAKGRLTYVSKPGQHSEVTLTTLVYGTGFSHIKSNLCIR